MRNHDLEFWKTYYKIRYYASITKACTKAEIDFLRAELPVKIYQKVLDFVCGFGRHSLLLAEKGYIVYGFDIDAESISSARHIAKEKGLKNLQFSVQDSTLFKSKKKFDAAICLYSSIGFLSPTQNKKAFKNLFSSVSEGGRIILDLMNPEWAKKQIVEHKEKSITHEGITYLVRHHRKLLQNPTREENDMEFIDEKGKTTKSSYTICLYSLQELRKLFAEAGFTIQKEYGSFLREPTGPNQQRLILVADKVSIAR